MNWLAFHLFVPKIGRNFLVCAATPDQAVRMVKFHAAILVAMAEQQQT